MKTETTISIDGIKGYLVVVGTTKGSGTFQYTETLKQAKEVGEKMKTSGLFPKEKTIYVDICKKNLKKCNMCGKLTEEVYCLRCEDLIFDAQMEQAEEKEEMLYA